MSKAKGGRSGRGGPRRGKAPELDMEHLLDTFNTYAKRVGNQGAFALGKYHSLTPQQAVVASSLSDLEDLVVDLHKVSPTLEFKYSDLKNGIKDTLKLHQGIVERFPVCEQVGLPGKLAESLMTICNHIRRLARSPAKFQEACSKASHFQIKKLENMKNLLQKDGRAPAQLPLETAGSEKAPASPKPSSVKTDDVLNMELPPTQSSCNDSLLDEAMETQPIPVRKAVLRKAVAEKKPSCKRPAASAGPSSAGSDAKKPKGSGGSPGGSDAKKEKMEGGDADAECFTDKRLQLMTYNKTGAVAIRITGGSQLLQIKSKKGLNKSKALASELLTKLKNGMSLGDAKAWKTAKLAKE